MGGAKKRPVSSTQNDSSGTQGDANAGTGKPTKKSESKKGSGQQQQQKQKLSVLVEEANGRKALDNMKAITVHSFARTIGVKISVANAYIRSLESKNILMCVGGYSGHRVYQLKK
jgi:small subunit ribosomal protein S25e